MSSIILTNTHQKNKILQLLPEMYLKRAYDIIPYNDYCQPLVCPMYDKSPVCIYISLDFIINCRYFAIRHSIFIYIYIYETFRLQGRYL